MATTRIPTESMKAKAVTLLEERATWQRGTSKRTGERFWLIPASDARTAHYATSAGCTCRSFLYRGICSHVVAVRALAELVDGWSPIPEAEQIAAEAWRRELTEMPEPARRKGYDELYPDNESTF
jgi:hypothetical protein